MLPLPLRRSADGENSRNRLPHLRLHFHSGASRDGSGYLQGFCPWHWRTILACRYVAPGAQQLSEVLYYAQRKLRAKRQTGIHDSAGMCLAVHEPDFMREVIFKGRPAANCRHLLVDPELEWAASGVFAPRLKHMGNRAPTFLLPAKVRKPVRL
jgi:hypothetical protein